VTLARAWSAISGPPGEPYLRMFTRLHDAAGEPLWPGFRRIATTDWLAPLEDGLRSLGDPSWPPSCSPSYAASSWTSPQPGYARTNRAFDDFLTTIDASSAIGRPG